MRSLIIYILILSTIKSFGQDLITELSIHWSNETIHFSESEETKIPYLIIKMKNMGTENVYFKNPFYDSDQYPNVASSHPNKDLELDSKNNLFDLFDSYKKSNEEITHVLIGDLFLKYQSFELLNKGSFEEFQNSKVYEGNSNKSQSLFLFYSMYQLQDYYQKKAINKTVPIFKNINKKNIEWKDVVKELREVDYLQNQRNCFEKTINFEERSRTQDLFVFLKPQEEKVIQFNLIGFKLLGGKYEFLLRDDSFDNKVYQCTSKKSRVKVKETILPDNISSYRVYKGRVISNSVAIDFR